MVEEKPDVKLDVKPNIVDEQLLKKVKVASYLSVFLGFFLPVIGILTSAFVLFKVKDKPHLRSLWNFHLRLVVVLVVVFFSTFLPLNYITGVIVLLIWLVLFGYHILSLHKTWTDLLAEKR